MTIGTPATSHDEGDYIDTAQGADVVLGGETVGDLTYLHPGALKRCPPRPTTGPRRE